MNTSSSNIPRRRHHVFALGIFAAVTVAVFWRAIFLGEVLAPLEMLSQDLPWKAVLPADTPIKNFTAVDVYHVFYPWKHFVHDELQAGRFPLWCNAVGCGYPLAGAGVIKLFGITTLYLWGWSPRIASILTYGTQLMIAMTGMYVLLRSWRLRWIAAVFGALVFGLNSGVFQYLEHEHMVGGVMMLPWLCWALHRHAKTQRMLSAYVGWGGIFWGVGIINGSLQSMTIIWLLGACFLLAALPTRPRSIWLKHWVIAVVIFTVIGLMVGAVALLPNLELFAQNARSRFHAIQWTALLFKRPVALLPWLVAMLNPDAIGNYQTFDITGVLLGQVGTSAATVSMWDLRTYCGLLALTLAVLGLRHGGEPRRGALVLALAPPIISFVSPVFLLLYLRPLYAASAGIAILAAMGLERLCAGDNAIKRDCRNIVVILAAAIVLALGIGLVIGVKRESLVSQLRQRDHKLTADVTRRQQRAGATIANFSLRGPAIGRFVVCASVVVLLLSLSRKGWAIGLSSACLAVNTLDLLDYSWRTLPSVPAMFEYPQAPSLDFLRRQQGTFRIASAWGLGEPATLRANLAIPYGLRDVRVLESLIPANPILNVQDWDELNVRYFMVPRAKETSESSWLAGRTLDPWFGAPLRAPGAHWRLVYDREVAIYENPHVRPRISYQRQLNSKEDAPATLDLQEDVSGHIRVRVDAPQPGWLVVRERLYSGWHATVNGRQTPINEVCGLWQAVPVGKGVSEVESVYRPTSVRGGVILSLIGLVVAVGVMRCGFQCNRVSEVS